MNQITRPQRKIYRVLNFFFIIVSSSIMILYLLGFLFLYSVGKSIVDESPTLYSDVIVAQEASVTGDWTAVVDEQMVEGPLSTTITAGVALSRRERPGDVVDVLGVDTGGHEDERPRISWTAPNILRVTVPNQSFLKILTRQVGDVRIDVRFDPDGPAARAAWLKRTDQPPD